jgi:predicted nucleic acid-binding protein
VFLLDTDVVFELRKAGTSNADVNLSQWASSVESGYLYLSSISVLELEIGVLRMERRDKRQGKVLRSWLANRVLPAFDGRVLPFDLAAAERCARFHVPDPRSDRDSFIAAIAQVHNLTVVTRNIQDFEPLGVPLLNPWQQTQSV